MLQRVLTLLAVLCTAIPALAVRVLTQADVTRHGLTVKEECTLNGATLQLPKGSKLVFDGNGSLSGGTLSGHNIKVVAPNDLLMFSNVTLDGSWTITKGRYGVAVPQNGGYALALCSGTTLRIDGELVLRGNPFKSYKMIEVRGKRNVTITGRGTITGDVTTHTGTEGEWGMGISIVSSRNVTVKGLTIRQCWGDCIYIGQQTQRRSDYCEKVMIDGVTCDSGRRQGLSLITGKNVTIKNCRFVHTGALGCTAPANGLDVEPNTDDATLDGIIIDRCTFEDNNRKHFGDLQLCRINKSGAVAVKRCKGLKKVSIHTESYNIRFDNCDIDTLYIGNRKADANIVVGRSCKVKHTTHDIKPKKASTAHCVGLVFLGLLALLGSGWAVKRFVPLRKAS